MIVKTFCNKFNPMNVHGLLYINKNYISHYVSPPFQAISVMNINNIILVLQKYLCDRCTAGPFSVGSWDSHLLVYE